MIAIVGIQVLPLWAARRFSQVSVAAGSFAAFDGLSAFQYLGALGSGFRRSSARQLPLGASAIRCWFRHSHGGAGTGSRRSARFVVRRQYA